jgi:hypothetical protein
MAGHRGHHHVTIMPEWDSIPGEAGGRNENIAAHFFCCTSGMGFQESPGA